MRQRGYQFMEGFLCPISSVKGHVPRVLTLVTSLASSLPGDLGPGVFITNPLHCPTTTSPAAAPKHSSPHGGKQNTSVPFLRLGTCTNWMHIHTLIHDDPYVDFCLALNIQRSALVYPNPACFSLTSCMFFFSCLHEPTWFFWCWFLRHWLIVRTWSPMLCSSPWAHARSCVWFCTAGVWHMHAYMDASGTAVWVSALSVWVWQRKALSMSVCFNASHLVS